MSMLLAIKTVTVKVHRFIRIRSNLTSFSSTTSEVTRSTSSSTGTSRSKCVQHILVSWRILKIDPAFSLQQFWLELDQSPTWLFWLVPGLDEQDWTWQVTLTELSAITVVSDSFSSRTSNWYLIPFTRERKPAMVSSSSIPMLNNGWHKLLLAVTWRLIVNRF